MSHAVLRDTFNLNFTWTEINAVMAQLLVGPPTDRHYSET